MSLDSIPPHQHTLIRRILPTLTTIDQVNSVHLIGSLARGTGDRWSSIDLEIGLEPAPLSSGLPEELRIILASIGGAGDPADVFALPPANPRALISFLIPHHPSEGRGSLLPSLVLLQLRTSAAYSNNAHDDRVLHKKPLFERHAPSRMPDRDITSVTTQKKRISDRLHLFWGQLQRLAGPVNRQDFLAASQLMERIRGLLVEIVVQLNGATLPDYSLRPASYLGPHQIDGLQRTLNVSPLSREGWIGAAVALVVLFRWYAPQVAEAYGFESPSRLEHAVLNYLASEIDGWPAHIETA